MPLRVPPPDATTVFEQYVIDSLLHLDECIDDLKKNVEKNDVVTREALSEIKAEVSVTAVLHKDDNTSILEKIREHQRFHDEMEKIAKAKKSVWQYQGRMVEKVVDIASAGGVIAAILYLGKLLGLS